MLKIINTPRGRRITWQRHDMQTMVRIIGAEAAARRRTTVNPSILKLAKRFGLELSPKARKELANARYSRELYKTFIERADAPGESWYKPYQRVDIDTMRLAGPKYRSFLLAHRVGAGKTLESLALVTPKYDVDGHRILVVTTNSAKLQWRDEIRRWCAPDAPVTILEGTIEEQNQQALANGFVIAHWEALRHARSGLLARPWNAVIADEAHKIQSRDALRTEVLWALGRRADRRIANTAHPYANHPGELFPILKFLYPDIYTNYWAWAHLHLEMYPKEFGGYEIVGPLRPKLLEWEIAPFTLRRTEGIGMPRLTRVKRWAEMTKTAWKEYAKIRKQFFAELEGFDGEPKILAIPSVLARLTRLRQYVIDPALLGGRQASVKYPIVKDLIDATNEPPVIFTSFETAAGNLQQWLKKNGNYAAPVISGDVETADRRKLGKAFVKGKYDALIVVTAAGQEALNLGGHGHVIFLDLPWNARNLEQAEGRVDRPREGDGKIIPTTAYRIVVRDSYEERIEQKIIDKHDMFNAVFSVGELKELFS